MLHIFGFPSPNGLKVTIMAEECGLPHRFHHVDILTGEQFDPMFLAISPNNKIPALVDDDNPAAPVTLFESGAILEYLAEKSGLFLDPAARWEIKAWLYWQMAALGPMAGQAHHFRKFAPERPPYAVKRYTDEVNRLYGVLNGRLENREFIAGEISIADFACWPWIQRYDWQGQNLIEFPNIERWFTAIGARAAVKRALAPGAEVHAPQEAYRFLYGQTAESVAKRRNERSGG
jgi:GST-like protein